MRAGRVAALLLALLAAALPLAPAAAQAAPARPRLPSMAAGRDRDRVPAAATDEVPGVAVAPSVAARGFRSERHYLEHCARHAAEFGRIDCPAYLQRARALRDRPSGGAVLEAVRADGVVTRFDRATGDFLATDPDGTIRTFFRPNDGERYFRRQAARRPR
ncbi:MAG: hypothetical protein NW201_03135 [Gemmatimonadales bacterium]|nr:hypothetical protein [Gemmatimonadales bacterium]